MGRPEGKQGSQRRPNIRWRALVYTSCSSDLKDKTSALTLEAFATKRNRRGGEERTTSSFVTSLFTAPSTPKSQRDKTDVQRYILSAVNSIFFSSFLAPYLLLVLTGVGNVSLYLRVRHGSSCKQYSISDQSNDHSNRSLMMSYTAEAFYSESREV